MSSKIIANLRKLLNLNQNQVPKGFVSVSYDTNTNERVLVGISGRIYRIPLKPKPRFTSNDYIMVAKVEPGNPRLRALTPKSSESLLQKIRRVVKSGMKSESFSPVTVKLDEEEKLFAQGMRVAGMSDWLIGELLVRGAAKKSAPY